MNKKYDIYPKPNTTDEFVFKDLVNNIEYPFKRDVNLVSQFQRLVALGRIDFVKTLKEAGATKDDLITRNDNGDGTVSYDESAYRELEQKHIEEFRAIRILTLIEKCFEEGFNLNNALEKLGIDAETAMLIGQKLGKVLFSTGSGESDDTFPSSSETVPAEEKAAEQDNN